MKLPDINEFIGKQLAFVDEQVVAIGHEVREPTPEATYPRDIDIKIGDQWLDHTTVLSVDYSVEDKPWVTKDLYPVFNWGQVMKSSFIDIQRDQENGRPFNREVLDKGVRVNWNRSLDYITYRGWNGYPGLFNNDGIQRVNLPSGGGGSSRWTDKSADEILIDVDAATLLTGDVANALLIPPDTYETLKDRKLFDWVRENSRIVKNGGQLKIFASAWSEGIGEGGTNRLVAYCRDEDRIYLDIPVAMQKIITQASVTEGGQLLTMFLGQVGVVKFLFRDCVAYCDGV